MHLRKIYGCMSVGERQKDVFNFSQYFNYLLFCLLASSKLGAKQYEHYFYN